MEFYLNWNLLPQYFYFSLSRVPSPPTEAIRERNVVDVWWFLRPRFILLLFFIIRVFVFTLLFWYFGWEFLVLSFFPLPSRVKKKIFPLCVQTPPGKKMEKKLIFILLLIGFSSFFFFGKTKKNIHFVVNRFVGLILCCPLSLDHCRTVLDDAFSSLWCLRRRRKRSKQHQRRWFMLSPSLLRIHRLRRPARQPSTKDGWIREASWRGKYGRANARWCKPLRDKSSRSLCFQWRRF